MNLKSSFSTDTTTEIHYHRASWLNRRKISQGNVMNGNIINSESVRNRFTPAEWHMRQQLASCYRLVAHHEWDDLAFTHISARVPGVGHHFLTDSFDLMFEEITASSLVKVNLEGRKVMPSQFNINPTGYRVQEPVRAAP